jgi:hypothetical protein
MPLPFEVPILGSFSVGRVKSSAMATDRMGHQNARFIRQGGCLSNGGPSVWSLEDNDSRPVVALQLQRAPAQHPIQ